MSHYDCRNCGATMGVDIGSCESCTPQIYFEIKEELINRLDELEKYYKDISFAKLSTKLSNQTKNLPYKEAIKVLIENDPDIVFFRKTLKDIIKTPKNYNDISLEELIDINKKIKKHPELFAIAQRHS